MRAIIIATRYHSELTPLNERYPVALLPLVDRPFIQHVIEYLVDQGFTDFDFVLCDKPEITESFLGDGTRWGSRFSYHLVRDPHKPYGALTHLTLDDSPEPLLLVHADRFLNLQLDKTKPNTKIATMFYHENDTEKHIEDQIKWTGWAWLDKQHLETLPESADEKKLEAHLLGENAQKATIIHTEKPLSALSYKDLLSSHQQVLAQEKSHLLINGNQKQAGIRLSRNVRLHPTAKLIPPVYIGENCQVGAETKLGPNVSIGHNCILDKACAVDNSIIFPESYIGGGLEVADTLVDGNRLLNLQLGSAVSVADSFILGRMRNTGVQSQVATGLSRLMAGVLLMVTWPVLLFIALYLKIKRKTSIFHRKKVVRLSTPFNQTVWNTFDLWQFDTPETSPKHGLQHFAFCFLPALINVVKGDLHFVGVPARSKDEIQNLSPDWQNLYLSSKVGIITESYVRHGATPTVDEQYAADAFYAVHASFKYDLNLVKGYLGLIWRAIWA